VITAVAEMFLAIFASDCLTRLYHVSDMEGQRGYAIIFLVAPLGIIAGSLVGLTAALRTRWSGFIGFVKTQGLWIEAWSDWTLASQRVDLSPVPEPERIAVRAIAFAPLIDSVAAVCDRRTI
jgi:hypothetical protein